MVYVGVRAHARRRRQNWYEMQLINFYVSREDKERPTRPAEQELRVDPDGRGPRPSALGEDLGGSVVGGVINSSMAAVPQLVPEDGTHPDENHAHATLGASTSASCMREGRDNESILVVQDGAVPLINNCRSLVCSPMRQEIEGMTAGEAVAYGKLKSFCSNIIKRLAPPLLKEVQASQLRPEAEPFTPKRTTRASKKTTATKRARDTPVENVLLHALGMASNDLEVDEGVVHELKELFDSPLREHHVRVIAAIFGKTPPQGTKMGGSSTVIMAA